MLGTLTNTEGVSDWWTIKEKRCLSLMMLGIGNRDVGTKTGFEVSAVKRSDPCAEGITAL
jgi:hypothetical protein|tara:strand:- start:1674 stop:1853 length:180 start_codon:yes stop_codon:yes gene_type:complete